ncbi:ROK family protein [Streptomyces sp. B8F3]|uniref:ROK family protein n=1 Tax=unclassified Streptomyces TaxID=2593676 RepID=UPI00325D2237
MHGSTSRTTATWRALAEAAEADCPDVVYLGVGTGVGGGCVLGGRSVPGIARGSSEVGHMLVYRSGPVCDCGRRGCLQAVASGPATLRRAAQRRGREVTYDELAAAVGHDGPWARETLAETCSALGAAVVTLGEVQRPAIAVVGGGFTTGIPQLVPEVITRAGELRRTGVPVPEVRPAALDGLSSLAGALLLARQDD